MSAEDVSRTLLLSVLLCRFCDLFRKAEPFLAHPLYKPAEPSFFHINLLKEGVEGRRGIAQEFVVHEEAVILMAVYCEVFFSPIFPHMLFVDADAEKVRSHG